MTISTTTSRMEYTGDGGTVAFPYTFKILDQTHLRVWLVTTATGAKTLQTLTTHYTVSGVGDAGGGNVTMVTAPASTEELVIERLVPITQLTDYIENDAFPAETHEAALDKITMVLQDIRRDVDRSIQLDKETADSVSVVMPVPEANAFVGWDATATALVNLTTTLTATAVTSFIATLVDDTDAATARATLETLAEDLDRDSHATSAGTNTITLTLSPARTEYAAGDVITFLAGGTNTGAVTINVNGLGAKAIQKLGAALAAGDITTNDLVQIGYDGTQFQMLSIIRNPTFTDVTLRGLSTSAVDRTQTADASVTLGAVLDFEKDMQELRRTDWSGETDWVAYAKAANGVAWTYDMRVDVDDTDQQARVYDRLTGTLLSTLTIPDVGTMKAVQAGHGHIQIEGSTGYARFNLMTPNYDEAEFYDNTDTGILWADDSQNGDIGVYDGMHVSEYWPGYRPAFAINPGPTYTTYGVFIDTDGEWVRNSESGAGEWVRIFQNRVWYGRDDASTGVVYVSNDEISTISESLRNFDATTFPTSGKNAAIGLFPSGVFGTQDVASSPDNKWLAAVGSNGLALYRSLATPSGGWAQSDQWKRWGVWYRDDYSFPLLFEPTTVHGAARTSGNRTVANWLTDLLGGTAFTHTGGGLTATVKGSFTGIGNWTTGASIFEAAINNDVNNGIEFLQGWLFPQNTPGATVLFCSKYGGSGAGYYLSLNTSDLLEYAVTDGTGSSTASFSASQFYGKYVVIHFGRDRERGIQFLEVLAHDGTYARGEVAYTEGSATNAVNFALGCQNAGSPSLYMDDDALCFFQTSNIKSASGGHMSEFISPDEFKEMGRVLLDALYNEREMNLPHAAASGDVLFFDAKSRLYIGQAADGIHRIDLEGENLGVTDSYKTDNVVSGQGARDGASWVDSSGVVRDIKASENLRDKLASFNIIRNSSRGKFEPVEIIAPFRVQAGIGNQLVLFSTEFGDAKWDEIVFKLRGMHPTVDGANLLARVGRKNQGIISTANYIYDSHYHDSGVSTYQASVSTGASSLLMNVGCGNAAGEVTDLDLRVINPWTAVAGFSFEWMSNGVKTSSDVIGLQGLGRLSGGNLGELEAGVFFWSSGDFADDVHIGTAAAYGIRRY